MNDLPDFSSHKKRHEHKQKQFTPFPMNLPPAEDLEEGERVMVSIFFVKKNGKLYLNGGFVKNKYGVSQTKRRELDEKKALTSKETGQIVL